MPFAGEDSGDLIVRHSAPGEFKQPVRHLLAPGELGNRTDRHLHFEIGHGTAAPYDPGEGNVTRPPVEDYLVHETAQQRFSMSIRCGCVRPDLRQTTGKGNDLAVE